MTPLRPDAPPSQDPAAPAGAWRPIATGALADALAAALDEIAESLAAPRAAWLPDGVPADVHGAADLSLAGGSAGQAVFHAWLARLRSDPVASHRAALGLAHATDGVSRVPMDASLFSGFTGVAWALEHLGLAIADDGDPLAEVDEALLSHLAHGGPEHFDLVSGLVGLAVYALERGPKPRAGELLRRVVARLGDRAERVDGGLAWRTPPEAAAAPGFALGPFDLGLAHGVPGVIALLAAACLAEADVEGASEMLGGALRWLDAQRLPAGAGSAWSSSAGPGSTGAASRVAWCYGDLGIACALHLAGRALDDRGRRDEAVALALAAGARDAEAARVCDAPLCHGAAGVAHLLNRLHHASGEERLADLACAWLERALAWRTSGAGIGGFRTWAPLASPAGDWVEDPGLLSGSAGIGLAFTAALASTEPAWDRQLLLSARRPGR